MEKRVYRSQEQVFLFYFLHSCLFKKAYRSVKEGTKESARWKESERRKEKSDGIHSASDKAET
ncbi:hypothetical protein BDB00DRAFT_795725 [Zychaea mexicana]|uniref:uncharacterized protein n=1 Tax=Zychaea mexicana TaxID=64656 RepID=UPI0022FDC56B|nr:uncharacterized protein BDB00DRAFT_795725 [Zychaea mexicana]KAI9499181.1 hypothetical protein BDB00DRAFT_795725 [Zychaea mexicana]